MKIIGIALLFLVIVNSLIGVVNSLWPFNGKQQLSPVIFVPGDGGSQMEAKLNKSQSPYFYCAKQADWYSLWLNLELLVVPTVWCWVDNVKLYYDNITRTTHNTPGVEINIPGWGDPEVVEWIDPTHNKAGAYFKDIANMLVNELGYERKKNILGAPYDFRKAPNELKQFFIDLKELVEYTYESNKKTPITFISHSMGSPLTLVFLQQQTTDWKQKYVQRIISLAGAWGGSIKAVKVFAMGDNLDSIALSASILKQEQITNPSSAWLLPSPLFWNPSEVLVETPKRVYTMGQLEEFFTDLDYRTGWEMRKDNIHYSLNFSPPGVELHCLYGDGLQTVEKLRYKKPNIIDKTPELIYGLGDGTVNQRSLRACHHWMGYQSSNISNMALNGVDHLGILNAPKALTYIKNVLKL